MWDSECGIWNWRAALSFECLNHNESSAAYARCVILVEDGGKPFSECAERLIPLGESLG